jgi:hypothetical protein
MQEVGSWHSHDNGSASAELLQVDTPVKSRD